MSLIVPTLNAWGTAFIGFALPMLAQSSIVILLLLGLDWALRRRTRATVRYALCLLALVKLVLPPSLALPTGVAYWLPERPSAKTTVPVFAAASPDSASTPGAKGATPLLLPPRIPAPPTTSVPIRTGEGRAPVSRAFTWRAVALMVWLAVGAGMAAAVFRRGRMVSSVIRRSSDAPEPVRELAESCRRQLGLGRRALVRCGPDIGSPAVCGLGRPVIVIPPSLAENLRESEMRSVLLHELAHVKRGDLWVNHAQILLQLVYWFHPLVWLANARIRRLREQAVDEMTLVELRDEAESYPETLLRVAKLELRRPAAAGTVGIIGSGRALTERIQHILSRPSPGTARVGVAGLAAALLLGLVALPMGCRRAGGVSPAGQNNEAAAETTAGPEPPFVDSTGYSAEPATAAKYAIHAAGKISRVLQRQSKAYQTNEYTFTADVAGEKWRFRLVPLHPDYSFKPVKGPLGTGYRTTPDEILAYSDGTNFSCLTSTKVHHAKLAELGHIKIRPVKEFPEGGPGAVPYNVPPEMTALFYAYASQLFMQKLGRPDFFDPTPVERARGAAAFYLTNHLKPSSRWELLPRVPGLPAFLLTSNFPPLGYKMTVQGYANSSEAAVPPEFKDFMEAKTPNTNLVYEVTETMDAGGFLIPKEARLSNYYLVPAVAAAPGSPKKIGSILYSSIVINLQQARRGNDLLTSPPPAYFTSYVSEMTADSSRAAAELKRIPREPPPRAGQPAPAFEARTTTGEAVKFPQGYKGKVVLLEFWRIGGAHVPALFGRKAELAAARAKLHDAGFEILGVDLDRAGTDGPSSDLRRRLDIPWPQVWDGNGWKGEAAVKYRLGSMPCAFLVDGDTGMILAAGERLRGPDLIPTIEEALASKHAE